MAEFYVEIPTKIRWGNAIASLVTAASFSHDDIFAKVYIIFIPFWSLSELGQYFNTFFNNLSS